ncbi:uncharacterized protein LOC135823611 [Sycon ciliatum]|uniref:uncharacterized protein LOC135823611 n=1 Tax=Sycon ciliatum TaxID=27933 RepID=UPI0031F6D434
MASTAPPRSLPFAVDVQGFDQTRLKKQKPPRVRSKPRVRRMARARRHDPNKETTADIAGKQAPNAADQLAYEMLVQRVRAHRVIPFIGAGMSMPSLPSWYTLLKEVGENLGITLDPSAPGFAPMVATERLRDEVHKRNARIAREAAAAPPPPSSSSQSSSSSGGSARSGKRTLERQKSRVVSSDLADEILSVFRTFLKKHGDDVDNMLGPMLLAEPTPGLIHNDKLKQALQLPVSLMSGPWPLVMTTNWDSFLEAAFELLQDANGDKEPLDVWDADHPSSQHFYRRASRTIVRYRADVQEVFAELRAGLNPPRLLKLHGDFTLKGRPELVAGHADYRRLMVHGIAFTRLLQYISSNYSLMFYGSSLTDTDLLAMLDSLVESLGGEVGPHFWLTADEVSNERVNFLRRHYNVYTIRTPKAYQFKELSHLMIGISNKGWRVPDPLSFNKISFNYEVELSDALMCTNGSTQSAMELSVDDLLCTAIVSTVDSGNLEINPSSPMSIVPTRTRIRVTLVATARS